MTRLVAESPANDKGIIILTDGISIPTIKHCALLFKHQGKTIVLHLSENRQNPYGGSILQEDLASFMSNRTLIKSTIIDIDIPAILAYCKRNKTRKYNFAIYNCEQFLTDMLTGKKVSPQLNFYSLNAALFLAGIFI